MTTRHSAAGRILVALIVASLSGTAAFADEPVRPAVGKPLIQAQEYARRHDFTRALEAVNKAEAVRDKTANESLLIAQMRASIAQQSGDYQGAIAADEALLKTGQLGREQQQNLLMAEAGAEYQLKDYAATESAVERYEHAGGKSAAMKQLRIQSAFLAKDYKQAAALEGDNIAAELRARQTPGETDLQLLANSQIQIGDKSGLDNTMVDLVRFYPKPDYWAQLLHGLRADPNLPPRLQFDVDRLRLAVGLLTSTSDFMNAAELGVQAGLPQSALHVLDAGYNSGALGKDAGAARELRLVALVRQTIAAKKGSVAADLADARKSSDGNALVAEGYTMVDVGDGAAGLAAMKEGIAKGGLTAPDEATFHLGLAYLMAGDKDDAIRTFDTVGGNGPAAQLASLWKLEAAKTA